MLLIGNRARRQAIKPGQRQHGPGQRQGADEEDRGQRHRTNQSAGLPTGGGCQGQQQ